jgi:hypothetical protein
MKSESTAQLAAALAAAQGQMEAAKKDSANPFFKSKYADLSAVMDAIREPFAKNGLAYSQITASDGDNVSVETLLLHSSGEWISGILVLPVSKHDAQGIGSAITYARRYALSAIAGVSAEDDDGNAATVAAPNRNGTNAQRPAPPQSRQAAPSAAPKANTQTPPPDAAKAAPAPAAAPPEQTGTAAPPPGDPDPVLELLEAKSLADLTKKFNAMPPAWRKPGGREFNAFQSRRKELMPKSSTGDDDMDAQQQADLDGLGGEQT